MKKKQLWPMMRFVQSSKIMPHTSISFTVLRGGVGGGGGGEFSLWGGGGGGGGELRG